MSPEGGNLSPEERAKRAEAVRYARGTMGLVEGYKPSPLTRELQVRWIDGEIMIDQAGPRADVDLSLETETCP